MAEPGYFLDLEQALTQGGHWLWRRFRPGRPRPGESAAAVHLEDQHRALTTLLRVLSGRDLTIRTAGDVGGLRGPDLLLPAVVDISDSPELNRAVYLVRVVLAAGWAQGRAEPPEPGLDPDLDWIRRSCRLARTMAEELPGFAARYVEASEAEAAVRPDPVDLKGRSRWLETIRRMALRGEEPWTDPAAVAALTSARRSGRPGPEVLIWGREVLVEGEELGRDSDGGTPPAADGSEAEAPPFEELRVLLMDESDQIDVPVHVYEKVETLDNWSGGVRQMDGSDELEDQLEALEEIDLRDLIRGGEQAQSVYRADITLDIDIPDVSRMRPDDTGIAYDEWDRRRRRYRRDWTTVFPTPIPLGSDLWAAEAAARWSREIADLEWRLRRHRENLEATRRQLDGEDVDLDALVGELAAVRAGHGGNNRLYLRRQRRHRDHATLVLMDVSLSTDARVGERRVIDISREAVLVLGEVAERLGDQIRVMAFASHTRNQVRVWDVLDWDEPWSHGRRRLGLIRPQGYTRIGPAIRHATAEFEKVDARRKLMLLLTDGKPTDYDRYEGRYGVADVRQAIREATNSGVHLHALAVQAGAQDYLPSMLGPGRWELLTHPESLPESVATVHGRMTAI